MQKKKFNVVLFIVLLLIGILPGLIYLVAWLTQPSKPRKYTHNGYVSKLVCSILWIVNSAVLMMGIPLYAGFGLAAGIILLVLTILEKKNGKKFFNIIYLVIEAALLVPCFMGFWVYFLGGFLGTFIFGIVGPIRGLKYVGSKA